MIAEQADARARHQRSPATSSFAVRVSVGELSLVLTNPITAVTVALRLLPVCIPSPPYEAVTVLEPSTDGV